METFRKSDHRPSKISHEVTSLLWLADAGDQATRIVPVLDYGKNWLEEPVLSRVQATPRMAEEFGRALAYTHAAGAPHLGAPPPGHTTDGWMGEAPLPLLADGGSTSWGHYYAEYRVEPYIDCPAFSQTDRERLHQFAEKLASGAFDHDQPALVRSGEVSRLHGDLWSGNVMWTPDGVTLIDPAAQGGHGEEDLAMLGVFGCPHLETIRDAYAEASPLQDGWRERIGLHSLHILIIHAYLFGASYRSDVMQIVKKYG